MIEGMLPRRSIAFGLVTICVTLFPAPASLACIQSGPTVDQLLAKGDIAFVGATLSADEIRASGVEPRKHRYTFLVERVIKGPVGRRIAVTVSRFDGCGEASYILQGLGRKVGVIAHQVPGSWESNAGEVGEAGWFLGSAAGGRFLGKVGLWERLAARPTATTVKAIVLAMPIAAVIVAYRRMSWRRVWRKAGSGATAP